MVLKQGPSIRPSVRLSVRPSVRPSRVRPGSVRVRPGPSGSVWVRLGPSGPSVRPGPSGSVRSVRPSVRPPSFSDFIQKLG